MHLSHVPLKNTQTKLAKMEAALAARERERQRQEAEEAARRLADAEKRASSERPVMNHRSIYILLYSLYHSHLYDFDCARDHDDEEPFSWGMVRTF